MEKKNKRKNKVLNLTCIYLFIAFFISALMFIFLDVSHEMSTSMNISTNMYYNHTEYVNEILGDKEKLNEYEKMEFKNDFKLDFDHRIIVDYKEFKDNTLKNIDESKEEKDLFDKYGEAYIKLLYNNSIYKYKQSLINLFEMVIIFIVFIIIGLISYKCFSIIGSIVASAISFIIYYFIYSNLFFYLPLCGIVFVFIYNLLEYFKILKNNY